MGCGLHAIYIHTHTHSISIVKLDFHYSFAGLTDQKQTVEKEKGKEVGFCVKTYALVTVLP